MSKRGNPNWRKGQSGNPNGRPRVPEIEALREAIETVERRKKKKLFIHLVEQAFKDKTVLIALVRKIIPDRQVEEEERPVTPGAIKQIIFTTQRRKDEPEG